MRSEYSVKNSLYAIIGQAVSLIVGFVTRIAFVRILGEAYLGVNGIFYSVLSLLSLTELGMGSAFTYALYKPLANKEYERLGRLMNFYAVAYRIVALVVFLLGFCIVPFLPGILRDVPQVEHVTLIFLLFLLNSSLSYLFSYKRTLVNAAQLDYLNSINLAVFSCIQNALQLVFLIVTKNYLIYLLIQLLCTLMSNIAISYTAKKRFPYIQKVKGLPEKIELRPIAENVRSTLLARIGSVAVTGTDNLLIATVGVILVGLYSNYLLILQSVQMILQKVIEAVTASVGNLFTDREDAGHRLDVYEDITFAASWMYGFCAIALDLLMTRFIALVFGAGLEIPSLAVHIMSLNFFIAGLRQPNAMFINAAGLFYHVRWRGLIEAAVNLTVSAIFLWLGMGLVGVLLGTTVSHITVGLIWELLCVSKQCLHNSIASYIRITGKFTATILVGWVLTGFALHYVGDGVFGFVISGIITLIMPNLLMLLLFCRCREFAFLKNAMLKLFKRALGHGK